jgi:palmitoyl-protein thioesterase
LVPAQYFREWKYVDKYLQKGSFLPDINNERESWNATYADRMKTLNAFVMVKVKDDSMITPEESAVG